MSDSLTFSARCAASVLEPCLGFGIFAGSEFLSCFLSVASKTIAAISLG
jgi:hypothetical protein